MCFIYYAAECAALFHARVGLDSWFIVNAAK
jgi:hypothetical protein